MGLMKIAFYAPMKSPDHPQPSGDRTIARLLMRALAAAGGEIHLASDLRTWTASPDEKHLVRLLAASASQTKQLVDSFDQAGWRPDVWLTYHSHYKAPDLLGPMAAKALSIPYVIVEASYAARRVHGEWARWLAETRAGIEAADALLSFTERDRRGLLDICAPERLHNLPPFLGPAEFCATSPEARRHNGDDEHVRLVAVAMMRFGVKLASYELLADSLCRLGDTKWRLDIVGDGAAHGQVANAMSRLPAGRVIFHGTLSPNEARAVLQPGQIFVWPGIGEAFGMAYLEAQACGLPVVALRTAGVPEVVRHGEGGLLVDTMEPADFANAIRRLIDDVGLREELGRGARQNILQRHSLDAASKQLGRVLDGLVMRK